MILTTAMGIRLEKTNLIRRLRNNPTEAGKRLWNYLRRKQFHNLRFRRQFPVDRYVADFACVEKHLIIELDGGQHDGQANYDAKRTKVIESCGFKVIRFWNNEVFENIEGVLKDIETVLNFPPTGRGNMSEKS